MKRQQTKIVQRALIHPLPDSAIYLLSTLYSYQVHTCMHGHTHTNTHLYTQIFFFEPLECRLHISWFFPPKHSIFHKNAIFSYTITVINFSKLNMIQCFYLIYCLYSNFVSRPNNVLAFYTLHLRIQSRIGSYIQLSISLGSFNLEHFQNSYDTDIFEE